MEPRVISLLRYGLLGTLVFFSLIILGLSGNLLSTIPSGFIVPDYLGLDLAIAVITLVLVSVSLAIDFFRKGAFTSMVAVELGWSFVLMVLWIACAGDTTAARAGLSCSFVDVDGFGDVVGTDSSDEALCHEAQALIAFSWFNFLILLGWFITLVTFTVTAHSRGNTSVWTQPVSGTDFFAFKSGGQQAQPGYAIPVQQQYTGAPMQQQQYTGTPVHQQQASYPPAGYNPTAAGQV